MSSDRAAISTKTYSDLKERTDLYDIATVKMVGDLPNLGLTNPALSSEPLVDLGMNRTSGTDTNSWRSVWNLPTEDRVSPGNPVLFNGQIDGTLSDGTGVILDAHSGKDVAVRSSRGRFIAVNEYGAVFDVDGTLTFIPVTS